MPSQASMTSDSKHDDKMISSCVLEFLECSVCLQLYDEQEHSPRILPCGHTGCLSCLDDLPRKFIESLNPSSSSDAEKICLIKCPECIQWVKFPARGALGLPKNIQLARLLHNSGNPPSKATIPYETTKPSKASRRFSQKTSLVEAQSEWSSWIIGENSIVLDGTNNHEFLIFGTISYNPDAHQRVSLLPLTCNNPKTKKMTSDPSSSTIRYSDLALTAAEGLNDGLKEELRKLKGVSLLGHRHVCQLHGFWMNSQRVLYLVCENPRKNALELWERKAEDSQDSLNGSLKFSEGREETIRVLKIAAEICEIVVSLQSYALICGCLTPEFFGVDVFGHLVFDFNRALVTTQKVKQFVKKHAETSNSENSLRKPWLFCAPELLGNRETSKLRESESSSKHKTGVTAKSDVWSLGCLLLTLFCEDSALKSLPLSEKENLFPSSAEEVLSECRLGDFGHLICRCFDDDATSRPDAIDLWRSLSSWFVDTKELGKNVFNLKPPHEPHCRILGEAFPSFSFDGSYRIESDIVEGKLCEGKQPTSPRRDLGSDVAEPFESTERDEELDETHGENNVLVDDYSTEILDGHLDCVTALVAFGNHLLSASYDKTICVWSLHDYHRVCTLKGHEHRILALTIDPQTSFCFSGDYGGSIFVWDINCLPNQEMVKNWHDHEDWRYSGVHCLAISENGYLYSGSGDKTIKAWSIKDYSLISVMEGHKSVVSTLLTSQGLLYSGSWDGSVRIWLLGDHTPLQALESNVSAQAYPIRAIAISNDIIIAAYDNGWLQIWKGESLLKSFQVHDVAILGLYIQDDWILTGSLDKSIRMLHLSKVLDDTTAKVIDSESVVTSFCFVKGRLFAGMTNRQIRVLQNGSNMSSTEST